MLIQAHLPFSLPHPGPSFFSHHSKVILPSRYTPLHFKKKNLKRLFLIPPLMTSSTCHPSPKQVYWRIRAEASQQSGMWSSGRHTRPPQLPSPVNMTWPSAFPFQKIFIYLMLLWHTAKIIQLLIFFFKNGSQIFIVFCFYNILNLLCLKFTIIPLRARHSLSVSRSIVWTIIWWNRSSFLELHFGGINCLLQTFVFSDSCTCH